MDSTAATDFSLSTGGAAQPASPPQAAAAGAFSSPQQPPPAELVSDSSSQVPAVPLSLMGTHATTIVPLANTHQVVSLKLTNTNYLYWRMQMKPYLLGQGVFVDGSVPCPPSHIFDSSAGSSSIISPSFLRWKQHDQLILSALLSSLFVDVLHLVVDCSTSHCVWRTLEKALASLSNSRIMQLYGSFQDLRQGDSSVSLYMQQAKSLFHELAAAGRPMSLEDFNLYVFRGFCGEFKDLVMSLITKAEPLSYADLHSHLLTHEFLHKNSFHSMAAAPSLLSSSSLLQQPPLLPTPQFSAHHAMSHHSPNFSRNRGRSRGNWRPHSNCFTSQIGANLLQIGDQTTGSKPGAIPVLGSGLDSSMYAANCAPILGTQLPIVPSFVAALHSLLLILLLGISLLRLGSPTPAQINT